MAEELRNNPKRYNALDGLIYVGGRTEELGGYWLPTTGYYNGVFFPGVRYDSKEDRYIENFGGPGTIFTTIDEIGGSNGYSAQQGVQTYLYDASYVKLRELALAYNQMCIRDST